MAVSRLLAGNYREVWREDTASGFDGGTTVAVTTGIRLGAGDLGRVRAVLYLESIAGAPQVTDLGFTVVGGVLVVNFRNDAVGGNWAAWRLDVEMIHSVQQANSTYTGFFVAVSAAGVGTSVLVCTAPTRPVAPTLGMLCFLTDVGPNGTLVTWNGAAWVDGNSAVVP